ncbi:unnamed protein product, partial [Phaeothamnion confervicola]
GVRSVRREGRGEQTKRKRGRKIEKDDFCDTAGQLGWQWSRWRRQRATAAAARSAGGSARRRRRIRWRQRRRGRLRRLYGSINQDRRLQQGRLTIGEVLQARLDADSRTGFLSGAAGTTD